jgi:ribosomal protein L21E
MVRKKKIREKGKLQLSKYFQELNNGDFVAIVKEPSVQAKFPERIQGKTGIVEGKRGMSYIIKIRDQEKEKKFLIAPIHLKKIKTQK